MKRRVVVTGMGVVSPLGNDLKATWEGALAGRSGVGKITRFDAAPFPTQIAAEVKGFDPKLFIDHKDVKKHDLFTQYVMAAAGEAVADSSFSVDMFTPSRVGVILGVGIGGLGTLEEYHKAYLEGGPRKISPFLIPRMISNIAPGYIAIKYGCKGVNYTITSACTSSSHAIGESYRMISQGVQDCMITGGAESAITPIGIGGFCAMRALSTRNDDPTKASRPFDKDRDGFVMGEGSAILILEEREHALKRGAKIYAEVVGYGASCDAHHITAPCADGEGAVISMQSAIADGDLKPTQINYINAHGTSTDANDATESAAIKRLFGEYAYKGLVVSSTKSMTGHLLGAAGAIEAIFSIMAIKNSVIPPTINLDNLGEGCDLDYCPHTARKAEIQYALSNSFGFGGTNATVVFGRTSA